MRMATRSLPRSSTFPSWSTVTPGRFFSASSIEPVVWLAPSPSLYTFVSRPAARIADSVTRTCSRVTTRAIRMSPRSYDGLSGETSTSACVGRNPRNRTLIVYRPGSNPRMRKRPSSPATAPDSVSPDWAFQRTTVAKAIRDPLVASTARPETVAPAWARDGPGTRRSSNGSTRDRIRACFIGELKGQRTGEGGGAADRAVQHAQPSLPCHHTVAYILWEALVGAAHQMQ